MCETSHTLPPLAHAHSMRCSFHACLLMLNHAQVAQVCDECVCVCVCPLASTPAAKLRHNEAASTTTRRLLLETLEHRQDRNRECNHVPANDLPSDAPLQELQGRPQAQLVVHRIQQLHLAISAIQLDMFLVLSPSARNHRLNYAEASWRSAESGPVAVEHTDADELRRRRCSQHHALSNASARPRSTSLHLFIENARPRCAQRET